MKFVLFAAVCSFKKRSVKIAMTIATKIVGLKGRQYSLHRVPRRMYTFAFLLGIPRHTIALSPTLLSRHHAKQITLKASGIMSFDIISFIQQVTCKPFV